MSALIKHRQNLQKVCRVCGGNFLRPGAKRAVNRYDCNGTNTKTCKPWGTYLSRFCMVDISVDNPNVHPTHFCYNCHKYMTTCAKKEREGKSWSSKRDLHEWVPHNASSDCSLCKRHTAGTAGGRKKKSRSGRPKQSLPPVVLSPSSPIDSPTTEDLDPTMFPSTSNEPLTSNEASTSAVSPPSPMDTSDSPSPMDTSDSPSACSEAFESTATGLPVIPDLGHFQVPENICSRYDKNLAASNITDSYLCFLCSNILDNPTSTQCNHVFCSDCIHSWMDICKFCPVCRDPLNSEPKECDRTLNFVSKVKMMCQCEESKANNGVLLTNWLAHVLDCCGNQDIDAWKVKTIAEWSQRNMRDAESQTDDEDMTEDDSQRKKRKRSAGAGRPKQNLLTLKQQSQNLRLANIKNQIRAFAKEKAEDIHSVYFALLHNYLRSIQKFSIAADVLNLFQSGYLSMTQDACLAIRVNTFTSCQQYKKIYRTVNTACGSTVFVPLARLSESEAKYLPGSVSYSFDAPCFSERQHTGAIDVLNGYPLVAEMNPPNISGYRYFYDEAMATALKDIESDIMKGLDKLSPVQRQSVKTLKVSIKDGGDGLGDMKEMRNRGTQYPSKVVRMCFVILSVHAVLHGGEEVIVFTEDKPNSELACRTLLIALADEQDKRAMSIMCKPLMYEREVLQNNSMTIGNLTFSFLFYGTMYDEKMLRMGEGMMSAGSSYFCTLCNKLRLDNDIEPLEVTRTHENCIYNYDLYMRNENHVLRPELVKETNGIVNQPFLCTDPMIDATHADIHWGEKIFELYAREVAQVYDENKSLSAAEKQLVKEAAEQLKVFFRQELGLKKELMMVGNFARALFEEATVNLICEKLLPPQRVDVVRKYVNLFREMRSIYRSTNPPRGSAENYKQLSTEFKELVRDEFQYAYPLSNYQHKILDHVSDLLIEYGSVGKFSTEPLESGNKLCRRFWKCNAYKSPTMEMLHILKYHWLYTTRSLQKLVKNKSSNRCSLCNMCGHTARNCPSKDLGHDQVDDSI